MAGLDEFFFDAVRLPLAAATCSRIAATIGTHVQDFADVDIVTAEHCAILSGQLGLGSKDSAVCANLHTLQPEVTSQHADRKQLPTTAKWQASMQQNFAPQQAKPDYSHQQLPYPGNIGSDHEPHTATGVQQAFAPGHLAACHTDLVTESEAPAGSTTDDHNKSAQLAMNLAPSCHLARNKSEDTVCEVQINAASVKDSHAGGENGPVEELMDCSTNLLNSGIRVHKYSNAPFAFVA